MNLNELVKEAHENGRSKGFWGDYDGFRAVDDDEGQRCFLSERLALIHSEVSEALEELREESMEVPLNVIAHEQKPDGSVKPVGFASELADVVIRVADLCGALDIDLEKAVLEKLRYNRTRAPMHGKKF